MDETNEDYCLELRDDCEKFVGPCPECGIEQREDPEEFFDIES